jgi:hypothetical protein
MFIIPALLFVMFLVVTATGVNGTSSGIVHGQYESTADERLLAGEPRAVRSDEWNTQAAWTLYQVRSGMAEESNGLLEGVDAELPMDIPRKNWSEAFRPHLWGFTVLPLDQAQAWRWWLPGLLLIVFGYWFVVSFLPRRPISALLLSTAFFLTPYIQWWYLASTLWPAVWTFAALTAIRWLTASTSKWTPRVLAVVTGYLTVTMAMGVYVPLIVPAVMIVLGFGIGAAVHAGRVRDALRRLGPILVSGAAAVAVLGVWLALNLETVSGFLGTVYPGQRTIPTGSIDADIAFRLWSGNLSSLLVHAPVPFLGPSQSEASTVYAAPLVLAVPLLVVALRKGADGRRDAVSLGVLVALGVILAVLYVPGLDFFAHWLALDKTYTVRLFLALGQLGIIIPVLLIWRPQNRPGSTRPRWVGPIVVTALVGIMCMASVVHGMSVDPQAFVGLRWLLASIALTLCVGAFAQLRTLLGSALLFATAALGALGINPLYVGLFDIGETDVGRAIRATDADEPGVWVAIAGEATLGSVTLSSGVVGLAAVQGAPNPDLWEKIDPLDRYEAEWNRLGYIEWVPGEGAPTITNPGPDQILITFDSCEEFAQENVDYALSREAVDQECLTPIRVVKEAAVTYYLYEVVAP